MAIFNSYVSLPEENRPVSWCFLQQKISIFGGLAKIDHGKYVFS